MEKRRKRVLGDLCVPTCTHSLLDGNEHYSYSRLCDTDVSCDYRKLQADFGFTKICIVIMY